MEPRAERSQRSCTTGPASEIAIEKIAIERDGAADRDLSKLIATTLVAQLTAEDKAIIGHSAEALSLGDTGRVIALALAKASESDVGFIGHTTLGTGLPKGDITRYDFNAIIRFDGNLKQAEVDGETLAAILAVANQDSDIPLEKRFGDFVYGNRREARGGQALPDRHQRLDRGERQGLSRPRRHRLRRPPRAEAEGDGREKSRLASARKIVANPAGQPGLVDATGGEVANDDDGFRLIGNEVDAVQSAET